MPRLIEKLPPQAVCDVAKEVLIAAIAARKSDGLVNADLGKELGEAYVALFKAVYTGEF